MRTLGYEWFTAFRRIEHMKKVGLAFLFLLVFLLPFIAAAEETEQQSINRAYQCLQSEINNKTANSLSFQEAVLGVLALGDNEKAEQKIEAEKNTNCWPKSSCTLKDTAQGLLAYKTLGKETKPMEDYLISKNGSATGLQWFLVIDTANHQQTTCTLTYNGFQSDISIGEDMKISGDPGSCLSVVESGYWLEIAPACLDNKYSISCTEDFITTLLYQKADADTVYVSSETHSAPSSGTTDEQIKSKCFKLGSECDYEGSLWSALVLRHLGKDVSAYTPYLVAAAPDNENVFPSAFLYKLTGGDEYYSVLVQEQRSKQYWQTPGTKYNKFYDTALALLALQGKTVPEVDNAKSYLRQIQTPKGCWNSDNIRDTAFILYAGWPGTVVGGDDDPLNNTPGPNPFSCASFQGFCESSALECVTAGGNVIEEGDCTGLMYCCSVPVPEATCSQKGGVLCPSGETCQGTTADSSDIGLCCLGTCQAAPTTQQNACEQIGGACQPSCDVDTETEDSTSCSTLGSVCCLPKESGSGSSMLWIILLIILIVIAVLAIIFRKKLQLWFYKLRYRGSVSSSPMMVGRPPFPPRPPSAPMNYNRPMPAGAPQQAQRPAAPVSRDKDMEETLKKLRDMSK